MGLSYPFSLAPRAPRRIDNRPPPPIPEPPVNDLPVPPVPASWHGYFQYTDSHHHDEDVHYLDVVLEREMDFQIDVEEGIFRTTMPAGTRFDLCEYNAETSWFRFYPDINDQDLVFCVPKCSCCNSIARLEQPVAEVAAE